jgi:hypothetical protein
MPDFQTAIIRVIIVGTLIIGVGFTGLYFVFRSFGDEKDDRRRTLLMSALLLFIFVCCLLLYIASR